MNKRLSRAANRLAGILYSLNSQKIVFAESCTAGLVSATMATVPGISNYLCGSYVTYRESAKQKMLNVEAELLAKHTAVSEQASEAMARQSLLQMDEASWSGAITGHLGPGAPNELDGKVFVAIAHRVDSKVEVCLQVTVELQGSTRIERQESAAAFLLEKLADEMCE